VHSISTRNKVQLHSPIAIFASYQKGVYGVSTKIFNTLPAEVNDSKNFYHLYEGFLIVESFYSIKMNI